MLTLPFQSEKKPLGRRFSSLLIEFRITVNLLLFVPTLFCCTPMIDWFMAGDFIPMGLYAMSDVQEDTFVTTQNFLAHK
jgi:hypothetical protein